MKISKLLRYSVVGLGTLLVIALILCTERPETMNEFPAPSWHEITPGQTTERELILQLGRPDKVFWGDLSGAYDWIDVLAQIHNRLCG